MYNAIETTMKRETVLACTLLLSVYTEILGGFVNGRLKEERSSRENYEAFLEYLGDSYVKLNYELEKRGTNLHNEVRSKIVHEFQPRPGFAITLEETMTEKPGLEYPSLGDARYSLIKDKSLNFPSPRFLIFRVKEYYRDFQKAVDEYETRINAESQKDPMERQLQANFLNVISIRPGED